MALKKKKKKPHALREVLFSSATLVYTRVRAKGGVFDVYVRIYDIHDFFFSDFPPVVEWFSVPSDLSADRKVTNLPDPVLHRRDTVMTFKKQREPAKHRPGVFLLFRATHVVQGEV